MLQPKCLPRAARHVSRVVLPCWCWAQGMAHRRYLSAAVDRRGVFGAASVIALNKGKGPASNPEAGRQRVIKSLTNYAVSFHIRKR